MNPVLPPPRRPAARSEAAVATLPPEGADPPPEGANLVVTDASVSDESPPPGGSTTLTVTVRNMGGSVAPATILRYYRSTDATITASDTQVGTGAVGALAAAGTSDESISLTASFTSGAYYYWACVDAVTAESDTTNNCSSSVRVDVDDHYRIRLQFHSSFPSTYQNAIRAAADTWETILADTELPSIHWGRPLSCLGFSTEENPGSVDDLLILVAADSIGEGLAHAAHCNFVSGGFPVFGTVVFDEDDFEFLNANGILVHVALHEIAHVLGFGHIWYDLLKNPSSATDTLDSYFAGSQAIEAFEAAGGAAYTGAKVPVQNTGSSRNSHWPKPYSLASS